MNKFKPKTFRKKLTLVFFLFAVLIFALLWIFQTVLLQRFYKTMKFLTVKNAAEKIEEKFNALASSNTDDSASESFSEFLDECAYKNSLLVFIAEKNGDIIFFSDEYSSTYKKNYSPFEEVADEEKTQNENPWKRETQMNWQKGLRKNLPDNFDEFSQKLDFAASAYICEETENGRGNKFLTFGKFIDTKNNGKNSEKILYISAPIDSVNSTVAILRWLLFFVTIISILAAFFIARIFSERIARPILAISDNAKKLADGGGFENDLKESCSGFCMEIDALSSSLFETSQKLSRLENTRREFLANVSHDLRTPLTMIKGYAEMIANVSWENREDAKSDAAIIEREASRLGILVNDILDFSSMQAGKIELKPSQFDLADLAKKIVSQAQPLFLQNGIKIETKIEGGKKVFADEMRISQVIYNLLFNSYSHAFKGKENSAEKKITVRVESDSQKVIFSVSDNGDGISDEILQTIWDRYSTSQEKYHASGLGLSISKEILELHHADFGAENTAEGGCRFWFAVG